MTPRNAKPGRPRKPYRASWGEHINGLRKRGDGRWQIVDTGQAFVESDERLAVLRFRQWESNKENQKILLNADSLMEIKFNKQENGQYRISTKTLATMGWVAEAELWTWFREQLITRPEFVADQVGIPELARLADLPKQMPSPTLKEIGKMYQDKAEVKSKQRRQVELFWDDFAKWMASHKVATLRDLTPALIADYADHIKSQVKGKANGQGGSLKYLKNRFTTIRGVINFARKRGVHPADVRHALDCCAVLQVPKRNSSKDPHPIDPKDFHKLLDQTKDPRMRAFLLIMLNLCMYPSEALALDWSELGLEKRTVVTCRSKTSVIRIGVLWPRTIDAIMAIHPTEPLPNMPIFLSKLGNRWNVKTVNVQYRKLRRASGVDESVKCEDCRDGAYTTAIESGADLLQAKLLAGHATGISDHYAKRKPTMVAEVVKAIEAAYFGEN